MQAQQAVEDQDAAKEVWMRGRDRAVQTAKELVCLNVHKQTVNRVLEPYMWITEIVTFPESILQNMFELRANNEITHIQELHGIDWGAKPAQAEITAITTMMRLKFVGSIPVQVRYGDWHIPFVDDEEYDTLGKTNALIVSTVRCGRVSYLRENEKRDFTQDKERHDQWLRDKHMSCFEHCATPIVNLNRSTLYAGWETYRYYAERR